MSESVVKVQVTETYRLVKWDAAIVGDRPPDPNTIDATQHPACLEIVEIDAQGRATTVYRRD